MAAVAGAELAIVNGGNGTSTPLENGYVRARDPNRLPALRGDRLGAQHKLTLFRVRLDLPGELHLGPLVQAFEVIPSWIWAQYPSCPSLVQGQILLDS